MSVIPLLTSIWDVRNMITIITLLALIALALIALGSRTLHGRGRYLYNHLNYNGRYDRSQSMSNGLSSRCNGADLQYPGTGFTTSDGTSSRWSNNKALLQGGMIDNADSIRPHPPSTRPSRRLHPHMILLVGLILLVIPFLPASNLFFPVGFVVAERILYLPSMGLCMLVGYSAHKMATAKHKVISLCARAGLACLITTHATKTVLRNGDWHSQLTLFSSAVQHYPQNPHMLVNVAKEYREIGDHHQAELAYRRAMMVAPHSPAAFVNFGSMLKHLNRSGEAELVSTWQSSSLIFSIQCTFLQISVAPALA
jgi:hypothetical protein